MRGIQLQGSFLFTSPNVDPSDGWQDYADNLREEKGRHVFFNVSVTRSTGEMDSPRSASSVTSLRDAFTASVRGRRERRPSAPGVRGALRPFAFSFEIPRPEQSGQELPPTFTSVVAGECGSRGRMGVERSEVSYSVTAIWEAIDGSDRVV